MTITKDNIDKVYSHCLALETRTLFLTGTTPEEDVNTTQEAADNVLKGLHILESRNKDPITIVMNNNGGYEQAAIAIFDAIRACSSHVTIKVFGEASSAGSIILQAADERILSPNSYVMIHYGTWGHDGHPQEVRNWRAFGDKWDKWMEDLYLEKIKKKKPKFTRQKLKSMLQHDTILPAHEAVEIGLADKIGE